MEVIGELHSDYAVNVNFEGDKAAYWFADELVEFIDHAPGTEVDIGSERFTRTERGDWIKKGVGKPWWKFW